MIIEAAGPQEGAVRRAVETFNGNARTIFAFWAHGLQLV